MLSEPWLSNKIAYLQAIQLVIALCQCDLCSLFFAARHRLYDIQSICKAMFHLLFHKHSNKQLICFALRLRGVWITWIFHWYHHVALYLSTSTYQQVQACHGRNSTYKKNKMMVNHSIHPPNRWKTLIASRGFHHIYSRRLMETNKNRWDINAVDLQRWNSPDLE